MMPETDIPITRVHKWIEQFAGTNPEKPAIICDGVSVNYHDLWRMVLATAHMLRREGLEFGERVCIESTSAVDLVVSNIATMIVGGIAVPLAPVSVDARQYIVEDSSPHFMLGGKDQHSREFADSMGLAFLPLPSLDKASQVELDQIERPVKAGDLAMILYTSGTSSGIRKGVMLPYLALQESIDNRIEIMEINSDIVEYLASPIDVVFGFGRCRLCFQVGGTIVYDNGALNPMRVVSSIEKFGCNAIGGDSAIFALLLKHLGRQFASAAAGVRWVEIASQALPIDHKKRLMDIMPVARIFMNYGLTEAIFSTVNEFALRPEKLESTGRACPRVDVGIFDMNDRMCAANEIGEIRTRGTSMAVGYWNKEDLWNKVTSTGWYHTGDLGYLDDDGYLFVVGRADDQVNVGGRNVSPDEVERILAPELGAIPFAVCGIRCPDDPKGEILVLCVEQDAAIDLQSIQKNLHQKIDAYLIPTRLERVEHLPLTANGKVQRKKLKALIQPQD